MRRPRSWLLLVLIVTAIPSGPIASQARLGAKRNAGRFHLLARSENVLAINRVFCNLGSEGQICPVRGDLTGGLWPRGTPNQYVFNSGFQVAGIVGGTKTDNPWAGDTTGALFFDPRTGNTIGQQVRPIYNANDPADRADWPAAALVPSGDASEELFDPVLRGTPSASQGDLWWLTWEGDPSRGTDGTRRPHPLGLLLEQRAMAWNAPAGNEDILYFIFTIYNISSTRPADYAGVRPAMREILLEKARDFQAMNNAAYGITLPELGYPITDIFLAFAADMDVGDGGADYASVNVPFALGYTYQFDFSANPFPDGPQWVFDPSIFSPPFFPGVGFVGVKFLSSPRDSLGQPVGLTLFGNVINQTFPGGDLFGDPVDLAQVYRYFAAELDPTVGDGSCNQGDPKLSHICFIYDAQPTDIRFFQSSGPFTLPPGGFQSVAVAYIFAAPVATVDCSVACHVRPGDPTILGDAVRMSSGVNQIDSVTGYQGFVDANLDGRVDQSEFNTVPGSLLGKALVAQRVFDSKFLVPFGPDPPQFFLIPGDNKVTVLWRPSASETKGDQFFARATSPTVTTAAGGTMPNPQYDPNYRQYDVEGYRIYRGRVNSPERLRLVAQFDYKGTFIRDFTGQVNPIPECAPELDIKSGCPVSFDSPPPGVAPTKFLDVPLVGDIIQVRRGERSALPTGRAVLVQTDTAITGAASGCLQWGDAEQCRLRDTGVPFAFVDRGVRNDLRYFYAVTAFDVNSFSSVPSSLESPRTTEEVTPNRPASNFENSAVVRLTMAGRGTTLDTAAAVPALDPGTGRFSGPFPPADDVDLGLTELVKEVLAGPGSFSVRLDSLRLGLPNLYSLTATTQEGTIHLQVPIAQDTGVAPSDAVTTFDAVSVAQELAHRYKGSDGYALQARLQLALQGNEYTSAWGRGCLERSDGFAAAGTTGCEYNGPRWFDGPSPARNETKAQPQASHPQVAEIPGPMPDLNNAGELSGVATIQMPHAYLTTDSAYARIEQALGGAQRAADFNLYWGEAGLIDSVVDVTHNVPVPFDSLVMAGSWGVLNQDATTAAGSFDGRPDVLTAMDFTCVEPLRSEPLVQASLACKSPAAYLLSRTARPGPLAIWDQRTTNARVALTRSGGGFALYLAGNITAFELQAGLPSRGAVWSLRTYVGAISGGRGAAGDRGPYTFTSRPRPFTAVGEELRASYEVVNRVVPPTENDLSRVHTVPDPYYVMSKYEATTANKVLKFVNLPAQAIIRIYSSSGILVTLLEHRSDSYGGSEDWNLRSRNEQVVASGVYFYHIESGGARRVGRFTVVNFAE